MSSARGTANGRTPRGIAHLVIEVGDAGAARAFYGQALGLGHDRQRDWPVAGEDAFAFPSGQMLVLKPAEGPRTFPDSGVHQAYLAAPAALADIESRIAADGIPIHRYHEDRPAESRDGFYFADPDGNRIQLVKGGPGNGSAANGAAGIDHAAVQASDVEWEEAFFVGRLGLPVCHRVGWDTADYVRARAWAEGKEDMAPGTRRIDRRYRDVPGAEPGQGREVPRPNMQIFLAAGDAVLGIFLATQHEQEPPPGQAQGTPRVAFAVARDALEPLAEGLALAGAAVEGPVAHPDGSPIAASVYFRDPCGNFFEYCSTAGGGA